MAFKLTYTDGQETDYDDDTAYAVDNGVLKMGREDGKWTVLVSPSHWAVIELIPSSAKKGEDGGEKDGGEKDGAHEAHDDDKEDNDKEDKDTDKDTDKEDGDKD